ncbi:HlyD family secretion protein [Chloroflexota bacterium]
MRRGLVALVVLIIFGALAIGWWFARTSPDQAVGFLVSGGLEKGRAEEYVALIGGQAETEEEGALIASGSIEGDTVSIVSEFGGQIVSLFAGEGDAVSAGDVLVRFDTSSLEAENAQVSAAVAAAKANLESVKTGSHPAEILVAQAELRLAIAERNAAKTAWKDMQKLLADPHEIEAQVVEARAAVDLASASIEQQQARIAAAELERDRYRAQSSLEERQLYASLNYQVEAARAALDAARAEEKAAQTMLKALKALRRNPLALESQVHAAKSAYEIAAAGVGVAKSRYDELKAGTPAEDIAVAEAQVARAAAAGAPLEAQIEKMTLSSPIDGIVTSRSAHAGEAVTPGATLLTVADLDNVKLTIYIPENQLNRVYLGQEVEVVVDSYPGQVFVGTVAYISQQAEFTPKNVQTVEERVNMVFALKVRLANPGHLLKPGMPADALLR